MSPSMTPDPQVAEAVGLLSRYISNWEDDTRGNLPELQAAIRALLASHATLKARVAELEQWTDATLDHLSQGAVSVLTNRLSSANAEVATLTAENEKLRGKVGELEERNLDTTMLAHKWMRAHDLRAAGKPYDFPEPADLPNSIARAEAAEAQLATALRALKPFADLAPRFRQQDEGAWVSGLFRVTDVRMAAAIERRDWKTEPPPRDSGDGEGAMPGNDTGKGE